jgi:hypothetical protein
MPAKSPKQQRYMAMCAHSPGKANSSCPPKKVAQEFSHKPPGGYKASTSQMAQTLMKVKPT